MKIFLAGGHSRTWVFEEQVSDMKIFLAGAVTGNLNPFYTSFLKTGNETKALETFMGDDSMNHKIGSILSLKPYVLESFFYMNEEIERLLPYFGDFLLDSGAFTFMQSNADKNVNWDKYVEKYAECILKNDIKKFFELDIDSIVGYDRVLSYRKKLERLTDRQCIPVWHKSRGKDEFLKMCDEYPYVAIGGIVSKEIKPQHYRYFPWFINEAHKRKVKIHGLGFTHLKRLQEYHFDSVDSTSWVFGNKFGSIFKFDGKTIQKYDKPMGHTLANSRRTAVNNYLEWVKFQKYAETHF